MKKIIFNYKTASPFFGENEILMQKDAINAAHDKLYDKSGAGSDFLGWLDLPKNYDKSEFEKIKSAAKKINKSSDILIVIGIGGSYLGARAGMEFLNSPICNHASKTQIYFAGNSASSSYLAELTHLVGDRDFSVNVISKSGATVEPAIAFRAFKEMLEKRYGASGARERIYVTTDPKKGFLKTLADEKGYETFVIPNDVGGRFSVLTAVGLLPLAVGGTDIDRLMEGALFAWQEYSIRDIEKNICYQYAAARNFLYNSGKAIEILVNYEPSLHYLTEWWKQLYGESEGKDNKGIFPAGVDFSTDLHSLGQYILDGRRIIFETTIHIKNPKYDIILKKDEDGCADGLNYISGKSVNYINEAVMHATMMAHTDGGVPNLLITVPSRDEFNLGALFYFFQKSCGISGYLLGVNPFDQPGVEAYKKNMQTILKNAKDFKA